MIELSKSAKAFHDMEMLKPLGISRKQNDKCVY